VVKITEVANKNHWCHRCAMSSPFVQRNAKIRHSLGYLTKSLDLSTLLPSPAVTTTIATDTTNID